MFGTVCSAAAAAGAGAARLVATGALRWFGLAAAVAVVVVAERIVVGRPVAACAFSKFFSRLFLFILN